MFSTIPGGFWFDIWWILSPVAFRWLSYHGLGIWRKSAQHESFATTRSRRSPQWNQWNQARIFSMESIWWLAWWSYWVDFPILNTIIPLSHVWILEFPWLQRDFHIDDGIRMGRNQPFFSDSDCHALVRLCALLDPSAASERLSVTGGISRGEAVRSAVEYGGFNEVSWNEATVPENGGLII